MSDVHPVTLVALNAAISELSHKLRMALSERDRAREELANGHKKIAGWSVIWNPPPGSTLVDSLERLRQFSELTQDYATMVFNGTEVCAHSGDDVDKLLEAWERNRARGHR